jgi:hypothetical protein
LLRSVPWPVQEEEEEDGDGEEGEEGEEEGLGLLL